MNSSIDESTEAALNNKRKTLICNYNISIDSGNEIETKSNETHIKDFKNDILKEIARIIGDINQNQVALDSVIKDKLDISEDYRKKLKENASKHLAGTQLKKDIYEENTRHTISLVYYILGMGFMGYYIFKLLKK